MKTQREDPFVQRLLELALPENNTSASIHLGFLRHASATNCQNDSNKLTNFKLKPSLCTCINIMAIDDTALQGQIVY